MFAEFAHVITRTGIEGSVVRTVTVDPPYMYLVASLDGHILIVTESDLRPYAEVAALLSPNATWNGVERRHGDRRHGERRKALGETVELDRRRIDRRREERRWIVPLNLSA